MGAVRKNSLEGFVASLKGCSASPQNNREVFGAFSKNSLEGFVASLKGFWASLKEIVVEFTKDLLDNLLFFLWRLASLLKTNRSMPLGNGAIEAMPLGYM